MLSSEEDSELGSEVDTQSLSGYEACSDAESLPSDSSGKYVIPMHRRPGQPGVLSRRLPVVDQQSSTKLDSSYEENRNQRQQRTRRKPAWMRNNDWMVGQVHTSTVEPNRVVFS